MPKFFVEENQIKSNQITILGKDVNHIKNVLRKKQEDTLIICNQESNLDYLAKIAKIEEEKIICTIQEKLNTNAEAKVEITILQGLPKADKMELIIQKAVELGVYSITPVEMKRCVVKLQEKDKQKKLQRWQKIAQVAAKQCGRNIIPKIQEIKKLPNICQLCEKYDIVLVAYEKEEENKLKYELEKLKQDPKENLKIAILIGPEGGIEEAEIEQLKEAGAKVVTLGKRILRTETVALNMLSVIMYELED